MKDTRALFKPGVEGLSISDIPRARSLKRLATLGGSGWLIDMLSEGRLTSQFQPIVRVDDPKGWVLYRFTSVRFFDSTSLVPSGFSQLRRSSSRRFAAAEISALCSAPVSGNGNVSKHVVSV